jgi:hypothetical protein
MIGLMEPIHFLFSPGDGLVDAVQMLCNRTGLTYASMLQYKVYQAKQNISVAAVIATGVCKTEAA